MTRRWSARLCWWATAMTVASHSNAGVWGTQPVFGIAGDYASNPALLDQQNTAEAHASLLLDAPTNYVGDAFKLSILPSFRLSNAEGYSSLDSDYEHLTVGNEFDNERGMVTVTGAVARDSSLYHDYLLNGSTGVRRDTTSAEVNWDRQLSERFEFDTDVNWTRVRYGDVAAGIGTLVDYKYTSITPSLAWLQSERGKLTASVNVGRYNSLDGTTKSTNANLQLGFVKQLSEIWSLTASAGYSHANDEFDTSEEFLEFAQSGPIIVIVPVTVKSHQTGSVYSVNLNRRTELLQISVTASRQLAPTGFAYLSRQDNYEIKATYNESPRWVFSGAVHRTNYQLPDNSGAITDLNVTYLQLSAAWQWTEHWTLTMNASRVMDHYASTRFGIGSTGVSLELSRQFNWKSLQ
jgi:hypothetical protein